jgi:hypothetical protein
MPNLPRKPVKWPGTKSTRIGESWEVLRDIPLDDTSARAGLPRKRIGRGYKC